MLFFKTCKLKNYVTAWILYFTELISAAWAKWIILKQEIYEHTTLLLFFFFFFKKNHKFSLKWKIEEEQ